jgi:hypothetical protein
MTHLGLATRELDMQAVRAVMGLLFRSFAIWQIANLLGIGHGKQQ